MYTPEQSLGTAINVWTTRLFSWYTVVKRLLKILELKPQKSIDIYSDDKAAEKRMETVGVAEPRFVGDIMRNAHIMGRNGDFVSECTSQGEKTVQLEKMW